VKPTYYFNEGKEG